MLGTEGWRAADKDEYNKILRSTDRKWVSTFNHSCTACCSSRTDTSQPLCCGGPHRETWGGMSQLDMGRAVHAGGRVTSVT